MFEMFAEHPYIWSFVGIWTALFVWFLLSVKKKIDSGEIYDSSGN